MIHLSSSDRPINGGPWQQGGADSHLRDTDVIPTQNRQQDLPDVEGLQGDFIGRRGRIFGLALKTSIFTVLTLGIYRFWMKTRMRRWYWSAVRVGGVPGEYVGDPFEKLLGFLIAVVILAFYIGIVNLLLMFLSYSFFQDNFAAYFLSFVGVVPLWFYATYRARRYVLGRTRWRGIRFGLEPGAWGYAWRALVHWGLTLLTAGILWPRMTFWLEKYKTDRTWYGDVRLEQEGRWQMLFPAVRHVLIPTIIGGICAIAGAYANPALFLGTAACGVWFAFGIVYYRVKSWEILTNAKRAGDIVFRAQPNPGRVFWIYVGGYILSGFAASIFLGGFFLAAAIAAGIFSEIGASVEALAKIGEGAFAVAGVATYFAIFLIWTAMAHAFITMPLWKHYAETLTVIDPGQIGAISQRPRDEFEEAEGFAEALDVGAAI